MSRMRAPTWKDVRRVRRNFHDFYRRSPNLIRPRRYSDKMQWRKLFDLNPLYAVVLDKIAARDFIAARVGSEFLPPLLWTGETPDQVPFESLDPPYVVKCNHGSAMNIIVKNRADLDIPKVRATLNGFLAKNFGEAQCEAGYVPIRPRLLVERLMLEPDGTAPWEYYFFVFGGRTEIAQVIQVHDDRTKTSAFFDRLGRPMGWTFRKDNSGIARPECMEQLLTLADKLGAGFDHVRIDFYVWQGRPFIGEITVYSWSGMSPLNPPEWDEVLGSFWKLDKPVRRAIGATFASRVDSLRAGRKLSEPANA